MAQLRLVTAELEKIKFTTYKTKVGTVYRLTATSVTWDNAQLSEPCSGFISATDTDTDYSNIFYKCIPPCPLCPPQSSISSRWSQVYNY